MLFRSLPLPLPSTYPPDHPPCHWMYSRTSQVPTQLVSPPTPATPACIYHSPSLTVFNTVAGPATTTQQMRIPNDVSCSLKLLTLLYVHICMANSFPYTHSMKTVMLVCPGVRCCLPVLACMLCLCAVVVYGTVSSEWFLSIGRSLLQKVLYNIA